MRQALIPAAILVTVAAQGAQRRDVAPPPVSAQLERLTWPAAESLLARPDAVIVLPLGGGAVEHGPHLSLGTDLRLAEHLTRQVADLPGTIVAPALPYHYSPAFLEYPGSTSLSLNTARDLTIDVARTLARFGPRRFYALNTGLAAGQALAESAKILARDGILLRFTDIRAQLDASSGGLRKQPLGGHADEIETSMMLHLDEASVDMAKATAELAPASAPFVLTRRAGAPGTYSPTGVWGDATLATARKGALLVERLVRTIRADIDDLRRSTPPPPSPAPADPVAMAARGGETRGEGGKPAECLPGDDRTIRGLGPAFSVAWLNQDAVRLSQFWADGGDIVHPDGYVEGTAQIIRQNRASLFMRPEYRGSTHGLLIGQIRCITGDVAVADAKWDLRNVTDAKGQRVPPVEGLATLVLRRAAGRWEIEAYRYTMKDDAGASQPTVLTRPGLPGAIK